MKTCQFKFSDQTASFETYLDFYLKKKSTDCILYSNDGSKFRVHKELFGQTDFLREILSSTKEYCCGTIEVLCPCSKVELKVQLNSEWINEVIVSPKMQTYNSKDFCPTKKTWIIAKKTAYTHQKLTQKVLQSL